MSQDSIFRVAVAAIIASCVGVSALAYTSGFGAVGSLAFGVVAVPAMFAIVDVIDVVSGAFRKGQK